jgi:hypothetical protein
MSGQMDNEFTGRQTTYTSAGPPGSGTFTTTITRPYVANQTAHLLTPHIGPRDKNGAPYTPPAVQ